MALNAKQIDEVFQVKRYQIKYPITSYTFPKEAQIHQVHFDEDYMHVELLDGRLIAIPLWWIPTLNNAEPAEREKFEINRSRTAIVWDPEKGSINDEIHIEQYLNSFS